MSDCERRQGYVNIEHRVTVIEGKLDALNNKAEIAEASHQKIWQKLDEISGPVIRLAELHDPIVELIDGAKFRKALYRLAKYFVPLAAGALWVWEHMQMVLRFIFHK